MSGTTHLINLPDGCKNTWLLGLTVGYSRAFDTDNIVRHFFGDTICRRGITVSGSTVTDRNACDWLADYFYLPTDYRSTTRLCASVENIIFDVDWHLAFDEWCRGLYLQFHVPVVRTQWQLGRCEQICDRGSTAHEEGYFTPGELERTKLLDSFSTYLCGCYPEQNEYSCTDCLRRTVGADTQTAGVSYTTVFRPLRFAKIDGAKRSTTRAADLRGIMGWNFCQRDRYDWGVKAMISAPVGNRPRAAYFFEPVVGNGHHWEFGIGTRARVWLWQPDENNRSVSLHLDAHLDYLFGALQQRTFDLKCHAFSRYMLATRFGSLATLPFSTTGSSRPVKLQGGGITAGQQFRLEYMPVANLSTVDVTAKASAQGEITALVDMGWCGLHMDIGYNFWGRTRERVDRQCFCLLDNNERPWALKGDARMFGFLQADSDDTDSGITIVENTAIALSATQCGATIYAGTNGDSAVNGGIDMYQLATEGETEVPVGNLPSTGSDYAEQINTSIQPTVLRSDDLQLCDVGTCALSSTVFGHLSYTWNCERLTPSVGIGGLAEWGHNAYSTSGCSRAALSQWSCWFKGCLSY